MTRPVRVAVQIQPGGAPDYRTWRDAVLGADDLGVDVIFGYDHFHRPAMKALLPLVSRMGFVWPSVMCGLLDWLRGQRTKSAKRSCAILRLVGQMPKLDWLIHCCPKEC